MVYLQPTTASFALSPYPISSLPRRKSGAPVHYVRFGETPLVEVRHQAFVGIFAFRQYLEIVRNGYPQSGVPRGLDRVIYRYVEVSPTSSELWEKQYRIELWNLSALERIWVLRE